MTTFDTAVPTTGTERRAALFGVAGRVVFAIGWLAAGLLQGNAYSVGATTSAIQAQSERLTHGCSSSLKGWQVRAPSRSCT